MYCRNCGKQIDDKAVVCIGCGIPPRAEKKFCYNCGEATNGNQAVCTNCGVALAKVTGQISKSTITLLGIFLGGFGAHKFYMGSWGWGIVYLLTCWLYIPFAVAMVEWIRYVLMSDDEFAKKANTFQTQELGPFGFFW